MALGTSYKRNSDRNEKMIARNIKDTLALAKMLMCDYGHDQKTALDMGAQIVMGKCSIESVTSQLQKVLPNV